MRITAAAALAVLALAGCSSSTTTAVTVSSPAAPAAPPPALTLLHRIPGVTGCAAATADPEDLTQATCQLPDGSLVEVATFATAADEMQWIEGGGAGSPADPSYAGCCIQGAGWAATVGAPDYVDRGAAVVTPVLGGRVVNG